MRQHIRNPVDRRQHGLGHTAERLLEFKRVVGMGRYQGMDLDILAPDQIRDRYESLLLEIFP